MKRSWSGILMTLIAAVVVIVIIDRAAARISPPVNRREAEDGIRDLAQSNPDVLVLGSSHARTLHVLGQELAARTNHERTLVAVPVENGKIVVYDWTLQHRLAPLLEEKNSDGTLVRDRLRQFVLIIEWWDSCAPEEGQQRFKYWNLPSRAWAVDDFGSDVLNAGLNGYNRNYLQNRMRRLFADSALLFDRINQKLVSNAMDRLRGRPVLSPEAEQQKILTWQRLVEGGVSCIGSPEQMVALNNVISYVQSRGLKMSILLFPRKPDTLTDTAKATTLTRFASLISNIGARRGVDVIDLTTTSPLTDDDFMEDFDHVNQSGNAKFASWALDHSLHFFLESPSYERSSAGVQVSP